MRADQSRNGRDSTQWVGKPSEVAPGLLVATESLPESNGSAFRSGAFFTAHTERALISIQHAKRNTLKRERAVPLIRPRKSQ